MSRKSISETNSPLDLLIHEASRLVIISALNECPSADFNFLLNVTKLTRGNLSVHLSKLITAAYVKETKEFIDRKPHTDYCMTPIGKQAFQAYQKNWKMLTARKV